MKLEEAINEINNIYSCDNAEKYPFFLIVGAGVSCPDIPLASQIIKICMHECENKEYFTEWKKQSENLENEDEYSFWLSKAYPSKENRRKFFSNIILNSKISSSNLQIANILASRKVFNLVITPNFDDQIERSLNLLNFFDYYSSTNAIDNLSINLRSNNVQIVHVHSDYRNYDFKNLSYEINKESMNNGVLSMKDLVSNVLKDRSPIIVGYSGWENDLIMKAIKERITYETPYKYYWFCYNKNDYDRLPDWLKSNENVNFIIPEWFNKEDFEFYNKLKKLNLNFDVIGLNIIPANTVFLSIRNKFQIKSPEIFDNPLLPCENLIAQISKTEQVYKLDGLLDEYKELVKVHKNNKDILYKIKELYNDGDFYKFVNFVIRHLGKTSTLSDEDFKIVLEEYAIKSLEKFEFSHDLMERLLLFIFRIPLYRNTDETRKSAINALALLTVINKGEKVLYKYKRLYSYFEGKNDMQLLIAVNSRYIFHLKNTESIVRNEYNLVKPFFDTKDISSFFLAMKFCPCYIGLVMYKSIQEKNPKIIESFLTRLNKDEYSSLRKDKEIRFYLKQVLSIIKDYIKLDDIICQEIYNNYNLSDDSLLRKPS